MRRIIRQCQYRNNFLRGSTDSLFDTSRNNTAFDIHHEIKKSSQIVLLYLVSQRFQLRTKNESWHR